MNLRRMPVLSSFLALILLASGCQRTADVTVADAASRAGDAGSDVGDGVEPTDADASSAGDTNTYDVADDAGSQQDDADAAPPDAGTRSLDECDGWQDVHPEWLWCDGFEGQQTLQQKYDDVEANGLSQSEREAFSGTAALEQRYEPDQVNAGWLGWQVGDAPGADGEPAHREYFIRWYHKFESGFEGIPPKMARIRRIEPNWNKRYSVLHWIDPSSSKWEIVVDVHVPDSTQANSSGYLPVARSEFSYKDPANIGRWICHEMQVSNNTPGQQDGVYRVWADDNLVIERTGVDLRGATDGDLNEVMLDTYWNEGSPKAQSRFYDNFVISTERIGCL